MRKFGWPDEKIAETLALLSGCAKHVQPAQTIEAVPSDPDDNRVLECAVAAGSRYIVTADADLLRLGQYGSIALLRVADFMKLLENAGS